MVLLTCANSPLASARKACAEDAPHYARALTLCNAALQERPLAKTSRRPFGVLYFAHRPCGEPRESFSTAKWFVESKAMRSGEEGVHEK